MCDQGAGTYILSNKKGDARDNFYMSQSLDQIAPFNISWSELYPLIDQ